jgi:hypothetical protein
VAAAAAPSTSQIATFRTGRRKPLGEGTTDAARRTSDNGDPPVEIDPVHRLLAFSVTALSRDPPGTRMPIRCSTAVGSEARMEDLENRL